MTTDAVYASSIFRLHTSKQTQPIVDDIYYLVETKLPNEVNILPMPPAIAYPIAFTGYIAPLIANAAQQKHIWAITANRNLMI